jgi:hypothetical protein
MGLLYGRAGRLTSENAGFRPGQDGICISLPTASASNQLWVGIKQDTGKCFDAGKAGCDDAVHEIPFYVRPFERVFATASLFVAVDEGFG